jgi:hypothetical protein
VQVALATIVGAYAAQAGFVLSEETVVTVLGVGVAEDVGAVARQPPWTCSST